MLLYYIRLLRVYGFGVPISVFSWFERNVLYLGFFTKYRFPEQYENVNFSVRTLAFLNPEILKLICLREDLSSIQNLLLEAH